MARARTIAKKVSSLTPAEYKTLYGMNMRVNGCMQGELQECRRYGTGKVVIHYDQNYKIDGWALLFKHPPEKKHTAYFYVPVRSRRKGIGGKLMTRVTKIEKKPRTAPWDKRSASFFNKNKLLNSNYKYMLDYQ